MHLLYNSSRRPRDLLIYFHKIGKLRMKRSILLLILLTPFSASADTITLVADIWCPYNCDPADANPGILIEVAKYGLEKAGHKVEYSNVPWARAIEDSRSGKYTGIVGAYKDDAPDFVYPDKGIMVSNNDFFVKKGSTWKFNGIESLKTISLGTIRDYSYGEEIDQYIAENQKDTTKIQMRAGDEALSKNIRKLIAGRIDVTIEDAAVMNYQLKQSGLSSQVVQAGTFGGDDVHVAFSPANPKAAQYAEAVSVGLKELEKSGELEKIMAKYK